MKRFLPLVVLAFVGCELADEAAGKLAELKVAATVEPSREGQILREFFTVDFAQRKIAHLVQYDIPNFDAVRQPRPRIDEVIEKYGAADKVAEIDLSPFGVRQTGRIYFFERLGLITPMGQQDILWVLIDER